MERRVPFTRDLYIVSDSADVLKKAVDDGALIVQLRDKIGPESVIMEKAQEIRSYKEGRSFHFILNDDPALAVRVSADGVHVGQDMSTEEARRIAGPAMIVGKTTHNMEQARQAVRDGADYISVGPVYATPTKPGRPAVGLGYVREAAENLEIPFVAIGGIDLTNIDDVLEAGAKTIGIVRAHGDAKEMLRRIRGLRTITIRVNGKERTVEEGTSLKDFILGTGAKAEGVIAELNAKVIQRNFWADTALDHGDVLELVSLVGGG